VSADRPLTEIVAEGREVSKRAHLATERMTADRRLRVAECEQFFAEHGPRLLAVAEAALEAERLLRHALDESAEVGSCEALWVMQSAARGALAAFEAAAGAQEGAK
jgi:hypothetical protein